MTSPILPPLDVRIPAWDMDRLVERACPICGSVEKTETCIRPDRLKVAECIRCQTIYVSPAPSPDQLRELYGLYDRIHGRHPAIDVDAIALSYSLMDPREDVRIRELGSLLDLAGARVLDVGFGRGRFLYAARRLGADASGIEADTEAVQLARQLGIPAHLGDLREFVTDERFDAVTMLDFIEHPLDPLATLLRASTLLKQRGLLVLWTPNGGTALGDPNAVAFRVDLEHMQYFTTGTCSYLAERLGLRVIHLETLGFPALRAIDKRRPREASLPDLLKARAKRSRGTLRLIACWRSAVRVIRRAPDDRAGSYHLFCILQRSAGGDS